MYNKELVDLALAYEHVLLELYSHPMHDNDRILHVFADILEQYSLKDQIDLLTLVFVGKFQDADMTLTHQERFWAYRSKVKGLIGRKCEDKYLIPPKEHLPLEIAVIIQAGFPGCYGDSQLSRGIETVNAPTKASSVTPYRILLDHFSKVIEYVLINDY